MHTRHFGSDDALVVLPPLQLREHVQKLEHGPAHDGVRVHTLVDDRTRRPAPAAPPLAQTGAARLGPAGPASTPPACRPAATAAASGPGQGGLWSCRICGPRTPRRIRPCRARRAGGQGSGRRLRPGRSRRSGPAGPPGLRRARIGVSWATALPHAPFQTNLCPSGGNVEHVKKNSFPNNRRPPELGRRQSWVCVHLPVRQSRRSPWRLRPAFPDRTGVTGWASFDGRHEFRQFCFHFASLRSMNDRISPATSTTASSKAKCPASRTWTSAPGTSLL